MASRLACFRLSLFHKLCAREKKQCFRILLPVKRPFGFQRFQKSLLIQILCICSGRTEFPAESIYICTELVNAYFNFSRIHCLTSSSRSLYIRRHLSYGSLFLKIFSDIEIPGTEPKGSAPGLILPCRFLAPQKAAANRTPFSVFSILYEIPWWSSIVLVI